MVARVEADRFTILIKRKNLDLEKLPELLHRTHTRKNTKIEIYGRCGIYHIPKGCSLKVSDMCDSNHILIALIDLAHHLEMKVVAEGVETREQAEFLKNYGCDYLQGYYFSKPVTQEEFEQLLDGHLE